MTWPHIEPQKLFALPVAMQAEGLRLLEEMGKTRAEIGRLVGLSQREVGKLIDSEHEPYRRLGAEGELA